jgi:serine phosphatase RsbU (regulator of sigma subunit)
VTLAIWALAIIGLLFITSIFVHPIKKLSRAMALVGAGERNALDMGSGVSEFSEIGRAFDEMVSRLQQSESQLTDQTRIKKEMQLAKDIQETLLPKEIPVTEGFELAGNYRSALEMGGDYYDFFFVDKQAIGLVVGDVSGKGIGAAMIMTMVRTAMRTEARGNKRAADVLDKVNRLLADDIKKGMYITMFYVILDSAKHSINYSSAGHNPMILYRSSENNTYFLNPKGFAVGLQLGNPAIFASHIKSEQILLAKGDLLFIYTDGITEAMNAEREQFGETRLVNFIMANHYLSPDRFSKAMDKEISRFTGDYPQSDDITYIVVRRKEDASVAYYHRVSHLVDLVKNSNMLHERVLAETGFNEEEYEEVMARVEAEGLEAFRPTSEEPSDTESLSHATLEQSKKIVSIVRGNPTFGAKRLQTLLDSEPYGFEKLTINVINKELKKLKLDTVKRRRLFSERELSENTIYKDIDKDRA